MTVQHLQETGVGRTVNGLRKFDGNIGDAAKALVFKWKNMVADEDSSDEDEEETCIPDVPEDYSDNHITPKLEDIEENMSSLLDQSSESKATHKQMRGESVTKHNSAHLSKLKIEEKHEKHEKNKHFSKHYPRSEKTSRDLKSGVSSVKKVGNYRTMKQDHSRMDDVKQVNDKITEVNKENNKKRKHDHSDSSKEEVKKRKLSDSRSDDERSHVSISRKNDPHLSFSNVQMEQVKVKTEITDKDKHSIKREEKSRSSGSTKSASKQLSHKSKDSSDKEKHKKEEHKRHKRSDAKKDSSPHSKKELSKSKTSSSSSKDHDKNKDRNHKKERKDDKNTDEKKRETKIRLMREMNGDDGIDCNSGMLKKVHLYLFRCNSFLSMVVLHTQTRARMRKHRINTF